LRWTGCTRGARQTPWTATARGSISQPLADLEAELATFEDASSAHQADHDRFRIAATKGALAVEQIALVGVPVQRAAIDELAWVREDTA
jgi:hypothetical protein